MTRSTLAPLVLGVLFLATTPAFPAALAQREVHRNGLAGIDGLDGPQGVAMSPDAKHVYVASSAANAVAVFARDAITGTLSFVEAVHDDQNGVDGLARAQAVAVSPDGRHVYVAGGLDDAVAAFRRDPATGRLGFLQVVQHDDDAPEVEGLNGAEALTLSPDGTNVYVASDRDNAIAVFHRDRVTGLLAFVEVQRDGVGLVDGLAKARGVAVSPDGTSVYGAGSVDNALAVFQRDAVTGALTFVEVQKNGKGGVDGLLRARAVAVSPDGKNVYGAGGDDNAIAVFARDPATGALAFVEVERDAVNGVDGLDGVQALGVTADGARLYAASSGDDAVAVFTRDDVTGRLTFVEAQKNGKNGVTGLKDAQGAVPSPDGQHVYVIGFGEAALSVFLTRCGDGIVDADERCDDSNTKNGDCCSSSCQANPAGHACTSDKNLCTDDVCDGLGVCRHANNSLPCDDGAFCTANDVCHDGACQPGPPLDCSAAADQCVDGICDERNDRCGKPKRNGTTCDDGNLCTRADSCLAGACTGTNPVACTAQDQCHAAGVCDPATGLCSNPAQPDGAACSDGNGCTEGDACQGGACATGTPVVCQAADQCHTAGVCNPTTGRCSLPAKPDGTTCNDANACTQGESCRAGSCTPANRTACGPGDQCRGAGLCDPNTGQCSHPARPDGTGCDDGNACTEADTCRAGACTAGAPVLCVADGPCRLGGVCDPSTGECSEAPAPDGSRCDDGDVCTTGDTCHAGTCQPGGLTDRDSDRVCDARDVCPGVFDPAQLDRNGDGMGDACECSGAAPSRCLSGGGPKNADCLLEFNAAGGTVLGAGGKGKLRCADGDPACDRDGRANGECTFGVALCIGNADPRLPQCRPSDMVSLEVLSPNAERGGTTMDRQNATALEQGVATLGLEVRRRGRVVAQASGKTGTDLCSPLVELHVSAPAGARRKSMKRKLKIRGDAADGRRDVDVLLMECGR